MPKKKRSSTGERRKHYLTKKKCQENSVDILLDYAAIEKRGYDEDGYTDSAIAPLSLDEDVTPSSLDEDVAPLSLDEDVTPSSLNEDVAPLSPDKDVAPLSLGEDVVSLSIDENVTPLSLDENVAPLSLDENVAPLSLNEDVTPLSPGDVVSQECLDDSIYTNLSLDHSYASYSNVEDLKFNQDHSDSEGIPELPNHINIDTYTTIDESEEPLNLFDTLTREIKKQLSTPYVCISAEDSIDILEFYKVNGKISVKITVSINRTFQARILVHQKEILASHDFWSGLPSRYDSYSKFSSLMSKLKKYNVCIGNPDEEFQTLVPVGSGLSGSGSSEINAYREGDFCAQLGDLTYNSTIRSVNCGLLVEGTRCSKCSTYRRYLWERKHRMEAKSKHMEKNLLSSTYKHKDMTKEMLIEKIRQQKTSLNSLQHDVDRNQRIIKKQILQSGTVVPEHQNQEMADLLESCRDDVQKAFPDENSLQRLFWEQQMKFYKSGKNGMRWHPMIVRWCLYLKQKSSKAYDAMRECGFINLPSARTLFDYSHYVKSALGFQGDVVEMLRKEAEKKGLNSEDEKYKCYVGLLFDEIRVKEDLVYDKHSGEIVGYCNLDSIGNQVLEMEKLTSTKCPDPAKSMLVLMVRGVSTDLKFPLAGFATNSITADFLYPIIWKAVFILEEIVKLKVLFLTCDGASANRKFFNLHKVLDDQLIVHFTVNPHDRDRKIFFISDVPHLLKTTRNCFSNSFSHSQTRKLWKNGKDISWLHIIKLFEEHCELAIYNPCPKLTRAHIDMTSFGCMKVNLAAQVLSNSVANALEELYQEEVSETVEFVRNFNKFFDCLNVRSIYEGRNKRNPDLNPFKEADDARLEWLKSDFLGYLDQWSASVDSRAGDFTKSQRNGMKLSLQTITGLKISVNSIVECVKVMLNEGAKFVLTHHFNQDPLEQHFGHYRHKGGHNSNPTVYDVRNTMTELRTVGVQALTPRNGNIRRENGENVNPINNARLPKRKR